MSTAARAAAVALWLGLATAAGAQGDAFSVRLSTAPIDGTLQATVTGSGSVDVVVDGRELVLDGEFMGLSVPATAARLHLGAASGVRGAAFAELDVDRAVSGSVRGTVRLSRTQTEALENGRVYVQIDSSAAPDGNLWGWLIP